MGGNCSRNEAVKKVHGEFLLTEQRNVRLVYLATNVRIILK
jgi:hypothetical protein